MGNKDSKQASNNSTTESSLQNNYPVIQQYQFQQQQQQQQFDDFDYNQTPQDTAKFDDDEKVEAYKNLNAKLSDKKAYELEKGLSLSIRAKQKVLQLSSTIDQVLPVMISVQTLNSTAPKVDTATEGEQSRAPIDLICIVDRSGSMSGEKIELVKKTLKQMLEFLSENDRICIIQFDDSAQRLTPLTRVSKSNNKFLEKTINSLAARGGTNITIGFEIAMRVLKERKYQNPVSSIFLLSDGQDSSAESGVKGLISKYAESIQGYSINTFGFGKDHDSKMMNSICQLKDGSFYYIEDLKMVDEAFASALGGLLSVVGQDLKCEVSIVNQKPISDLKIQKTYGPMWTKSVQNSWEFGVKEVIRGNSKDFILEIRIPPMNLKIDDHQRNQSILKVALQVNKVGEEGVVKLEQELQVTFYNEDEKLEEIDEDGEVQANYFRVKAAEAMEEGRKMAEKGKYEEGQKQIQLIKDEIKSNKKIDQQKMQQISEDLQEAYDVCKPQIFEQQGIHKMQNMESAHYKQKATNLKADQSFNMYSNSCQTAMVQKVQSSKKK